MKRLLFFCVLFSAVHFSQPQLDSLLTAMRGKHDSVKIRKLADLCWEYRSIHPRVSITYGETALKLMSQSSDVRYKSEVLNYLGVIYGNLGQLDSAYTYYRRAIQLSRQNKDINQIAYSLNNLGDYYFKNALYSTALENIFEAYTLFEQINNRQGMAYCLNDLGEIYLVRKDYDKALDNFKRSAQLRLERNDKRGYAKSLINMAIVYENQTAYEKAFEAFDQALEASEASDYVKGKSWIYAGIAELYLKQEKFFYAMDNSQKALDIDLRIGNKYGEIINYNRLGLIAMKQNNLPLAQTYLEKAKQESDKTGHIDQLMISYKHLTELFTRKEDYKSAYSALKEYGRLNDRIFSEQTTNKMADLQTAFFLEKKDRETELLRKDLDYQKSTRNYLILITLLCIGVFALSIMKYKSQKKANDLLKELNTSKDKFFSIISHDLRSPMGAVSNLADILNTDYDDLSDAERKEVIRSLTEASSNVQNLLLDLLTWASSQKEGMGLNMTVLNLKNLISSTALANSLVAKNKDLTIEVEVADDLVLKADKYILETITGNFLNNAIKFSYPGTKILIKAVKGEKEIRISVTDFGKGIPPESLQKLMDVDSKISTPGTGNEKGTGLGLKICREFARLHNGRIDFTSELEKGSTFTFSFPAD